PLGDPVKIDADDSRQRLAAKDVTLDAAGVHQAVTGLKLLLILCGRPVGRQLCRVPTCLSNPGCRIDLQQPIAEFLRRSGRKLRHAGVHVRADFTGPLQHAVQPSWPCLASHTAQRRWYPPFISQILAANRLEVGSAIAADAAEFVPLVAGIAIEL